MFQNSNTSTMQAQTLLIIDDEPSNLCIVESYLEKAGFNLLLALSGEESLLIAKKALPDLILLDVMMSGMNGFETCLQLKKAPETREIPVIFMTALDNMEDKLKGFDVGAVDYITKPLNEKEVLARISTHLQLRSLQKDLQDKNQRLQEEIQRCTTAELAQRESETQFQVIFNNAYVAISLMNVTANYLQVNEEFIRLLGYSAAELEQVRCQDITHPDDQALSEQNLSRIRHREITSCAFDKHFIRKDGSMFLGSNWLAGLYDEDTQCCYGFVCVITDLTEREQTYAKIQTLSRAVEQTHSAVVITDNTGCIEFVNPAFTEATGYSTEEAVGAYPNILKSGYQDQAFYTNMWVTLKSGELWQGELVNKRKDGTIYWEYVTISPIKDEQDRIINFIAVKKDITERKAAEIALQEAKEKAEIASQAKSAFLANMSHEIRTPMNAILGFTEILNGMITDPTQQDYLKTIQNSGETLLDLINDILDLSKVEAGKMQLDETPVNLIKVFQEIAQMFKPKTQAKGLDFQVDIAQALPEWLLLDETRIRQILINLLGNAIKFTQQGVIRLSLIIHDLDIKNHVCSLEFSVQDSGIGIPLEQQENMFKAFEQQAGQSQAKYGGTGLGLAICQQLAMLMKGEIQVSSQVGKGSIFTINLDKLKILHPPSKRLKAHQPEQDVNFAPATILIVDDQMVNRKLLDLQLKKYGFKNLHANNGEEALFIIEETQPDLILLDMIMPIMNGMETIQQLKQNPKTRALPVIAVTADAITDEAKAFSQLCDGAVTKPIAKSELLEMLKSFLTIETQTQT
ncbi:response regulator [Candidatus Venteria ishoeyi]|uniref:response regulator n=1 Tax=Candidatus Venteria ishoeyi TaxID=1899563 RepID=UPI0025A57A24|nr:response regulator [Candidatus Venteria ishoeyi]MDM8545325.1 response regulator [Candidatus Venteria ishoeyi]